jgi:putative ABC transport system permease protein
MRYRDASQQKAFVRDLTSRLQQLPGAEIVAVTSNLPATGTGTVPVHIKDQPAPNPASPALNTLHFVVTPDFFRTTGIPLLHGRTFTETDDPAAPRVVLVNQKFVDNFLPSQDPLGKQIQMDITGTTPVWSEIVGVVGNVKSYSEATRDDPEVYEAFLQRPVQSFSVMLKTDTDPNGLASALRSTVAQMDIDLPLDQVMSMPAVIDQQKAGNPFFTRLLCSFAVLALILSAIGIYGLVAYSVGQRTHEIGIRMALGAHSQDVLRMVLGEGLKMAAIGGAIGLAMALPLPKLFGAMFFDLHVSEPRLYVIVPLAVFMVAIVATYFPARRAAGVNPMSALRQE